MAFSHPYYRDARQLPGPLPDQNEIERATRTLPKRSPDGGCLVVIRDIYVVKYGPLLNIAAPLLCAMYRDHDTLYIIMEYIPGVSLGMVALPSPGFYGSVNRGPAPLRYIFSREKDHAVTGPFQTEEEFGRAIALRSKTMWSETNHHSFLSDYLACHLPSALRNHPPTFTHGDLYRENVLVSKVINSITNEEEYEVAALIDDWPAYIEKILDPLPLEGAMMRVVFSDLEF
ncbi:phosphotransferase enzyme family protein [Aspergillus spinulosporus]